MTTGIILSRRTRVSGSSDGAEWPSSKCTRRNGFKGRKKLAVNGSKRGRRVYTGNHPGSWSLFRRGMESLMLHFESVARRLRSAPRVLFLVLTLTLGYSGAASADTWLPGDVITCGQGNWAAGCGGRLGADCLTLYPATFTVTLGLAGA